MSEMNINLPDTYATLLAKSVAERGDHEAIVTPDEVVTYAELDRRSAEMARALERERCDLLVLDLMLPGEDGLSICKRLRATGVKTPVIMLTAKGEDVDRINGLEIGADDYLGKPFNPRELLARIHAVLRRRPVNELPGSPSAEDEVINFGHFK